MKLFTKSALGLMVTVLAGIKVEQRSGAVWGLAIAGNLASLALLLAPTWNLYCSWKNGTLAEKRGTYGYGFDFWSCLMWICFAVLYLPLPNAKFVIIVNSLGAAAQTAYLMLCIWYSSWIQHRLAIGVFVMALISFTVVLTLVLTKTVTHHKGIQIVGGLAIATGLLSSLCTLILLIMMIKAKNLSGVDTLSVGFALLSGSIWLSYGLKFHPANIFVVVPSSASLIIAVAQIVTVTVFWMFAIAVAVAGLPIHAPLSAQLARIELSRVVAQALFVGGEQHRAQGLPPASTRVVQDRVNDPADLLSASASVVDLVDDPADLPLVAPPVSSESVYDDDLGCGSGARTVSHAPSSSVSRSPTRSGTPSALSNHSSGAPSPSCSRSPSAPSRPGSGAPSLSRPVSHAPSKPASPSDSRAPSKPLSPSGSGALSRSSSASDTQQ